MPQFCSAMIQSFDSAATKQAWSVLDLTGVSPSRASPVRLDLMLRLSLSLLAVTAAASAAVRSIEIAERAPVLDGACRRIVGRVHFGLRPSVEANRMVRDLDLAQR